MDEIKSYFESKDIGPKDITKGVIAHEVLGVGVLAGFWAGCYFVRPSGRFMTAMKLKKPALWSASEQRMQKSALLNKITQNKIISSGQATKLVISYVEGTFLRKLLVPVLVPAKLWLAAQIVIRTKS